MKTKVVVIGYIQNGDKFLIAKRHEPKIPEAHDKWELPGGTIEFGEDPKDTLLREIMEETGLRVKIGEMLPTCQSRVWQHDDYRIHALVICYKCEMIDGQLHLEDHKISDLRWIKMTEADQYDFLPSINEFFSLIE